MNPAVTLNARRNLPVTVGYTFSLGRTTANAAVFCSVFRVCSEADRALLSSFHRVAGFTASAAYDRVNSVVDPTNGTLISLNLMHASRWVLSDTLYQFNRAEMGVSRYYRLGRRGVFAWRARAGIIVPAGDISLAGQSVQFVPPEQRFLKRRRPNSVRGYARNELGPRVYVQPSLCRCRERTPPVCPWRPRGDRRQRDLRAQHRGPVRNAAVSGPDAGGPVRGRRPSVGAGGPADRGARRARHSRRGPAVRDPARPDPDRRGVQRLRRGAGPLYVQDNGTHTLTLTQASYQPAQAMGFFRRIFVQFAVGQAF